MALTLAKAIAALAILESSKAVSANPERFAPPQDERERKRRQVEDRNRRLAVEQPWELAPQTYWNPDRKKSDLSKRQARKARKQK